MKRILLFAIITIGILLSLVGCDDLSADDKALIRSFIEDWAHSKQLHPLNEDGSVSVEGLWNSGSRLLTGKTGDEEVDAVLDAYEMVENLVEADKLMEEGRRNQDPEKMDQAIERRPGDWTYHLSKAALTLKNGDMDAYQESTTEAFRINNKNNTDPMWVANQSIKEYEAVEQKLIVSGWKDSAQCITLYQELAIAYQTKSGITKSNDDLAKLDGAYNNMDRCRQ